MNNAQRYALLRELLPPPPDVHATHALYDDLEMFVAYSRDSYLCHFKLYPVAAKVDGVPQYLRLGNTGNDPDQWTTQVSEAEVLVEGSIRFDGCGNWSFPGTPACLTHTCGVEDMVSISLALLCAWRDCMMRNALDSEFSQHLLTESSLKT